MDYTIDSMHYNQRRVIQVSPNNRFEDLEKTLKAIESLLKNSSEAERRMLSFFEEEVEPKAAYKDNDVNQGEGGPRRLHIIGKLKKINGDNGLFVRLGILAPDENPLIPALQVLYLLDGIDANHPKYIKGLPVGIERDPDRWAYEFTERYGGMVQGVKVRTRAGIRSLAVIPAVNEAILSGTAKRLEEITY